MFGGSLSSLEFLCLFDSFVGLDEETKNMEHLEYGRILVKLTSPHSHTLNGIVCKVRCTEEKNTFVKNCECDR